MPGYRSNALARAWYYLTDNWVTGAVITAVILAVIAAAVFLGGWILMALLSLFIVGLAITFGSVTTLAGAIIIGVLLKVFETTIHAFVRVWWTGPASDRFFELVIASGYIELIATIFLVAYATRFTMSAIFGPIKLVSTNTTNKVNLSEPED